MFARSEREESQPQPTAAQPPAKPEARDAKFFQPCTFSSRKAEREARGEMAPRPQRLVSLGKTQVRLDGAGRDGMPRVIEVESYFDADHPNQFYARQEGTAHIEPVIRHTGENQKVVPLGTLPVRKNNSPKNWTPTAGPARADERVVLDD